MHKCILCLHINIPESKSNRVNQNSIKLMTSTKNHITNISSIYILLQIFFYYIPYNMTKYA